LLSAFCKIAKCMLKFKEMYTREILPPRISPVEDGNPVIGTWNESFEKVDLQEIRQPYNFPLPRWLRDYRIKEWQSFSVYNESYLLEALFCDLKIYQMAQIILYDRENQQKFIFREIKPGADWKLPGNLVNSSIDSHSLGFFFSIHSWLDAGTVKLDINIEAARKRPSLVVHIAYSVSHQDITPMAVSLGFSKRRTMYAFKALSPVHGEMVFDGKNIDLRQESCSGFFCDYKGFFPYKTQTTICKASGFDSDNRRFGFNIAENQTREKNKNNENALWLNGKLTPLPPVLITMPNGHEDKWVIQDVEGMVDLTFTPKIMNRNGTKLIFTKSDFIAHLGYYNGELLDSEGEKIQIKNLFGTGEKIYLRV